MRWLSDVQIGCVDFVGGATLCELGSAEST